MASQSAQNRANALNAKIEAQAGIVLEGLEKNLLRKVARESFACAVKCYDKAGNTGPQDLLEHCAQSCQGPYQQSTNLVQNVRYSESCHLRIKIELPDDSDSWPIFPLLRTQCNLQEVAQFQNRLNRNMQECQEKARDMMIPGIENDSRQMQKVEDVLINCMSKQVDVHIKLLNPMKDRIAAALKNYK